MQGSPVPGRELPGNVVKAQKLSSKFVPVSSTLFLHIAAARPFNEL